MFVWPVIALIFIAAGGVAGLTLGQSKGSTVWMIGLIVCGLPIVLGTVRDAARGLFATDIVAALAIVGAALFNSPFAGLVVVLMRQGGVALEKYAEGRASAAVRKLEEAAPRHAHRVRGDDVEDVPASDIEVGDELLVRPCELVPCDGQVIDGESDVDASTLTGEPIPVPAVPGSRLMSGSLNGAGALRIRASARAAESQYARIVELVRSAQSHKAPMQRMADRYAIWFTPLTLAVCAITYLMTHDWTRVLSVLVVATPCPLILATPVAFVGGVNRAARHHVIIRRGGALEALARVSAVVLDKTGTITLGEPKLDRIRVMNGKDAHEILQLAASVEQGSSHRMARTIVREAKSRTLDLKPARKFEECAGSGVIGVVDDHRVRLGSRTFVLEQAIADRRELAKIESGPALLRTYVAIDGHVAATFEFGEELRADALPFVQSLRAAGVERVLLVSGDRLAQVHSMATKAGITDIRGEVLPADKAAIVQALKREGETVMMVGDGTNDAPALAAASVGVALSGHGGGVSTEAADVIVLSDSLGAAAAAMAIGRDTTRIARQSIIVGLALSGAAMVWAALGGIRPVAGALLQEAIDIAVIVNALRAVRDRPM